MSENSPQRPLVVACPHCRKAYTVRQEHVGTTTKCRQCGQSFVITLPDAVKPLAAVSSGAPPSLAAEVASADSGLLCPICQCPLGVSDSVQSCPLCKTAHHADCWAYNRGCGLYGCKEAPETEKLQDIEIPASYWGQTEKQCPNCRRVIQAAAVRCRHCGTAFETARPQDASEFIAKRTQQMSLSTHRHTGIVLLILAVIPCTAPLAAVIGVIWYLVARRQIAALPPLQATICRLAVGISLAVTAFTIVAASIYSSHVAP